MVSFAQTHISVKNLYSTAYFPPISYFLYLADDTENWMEFHEHYLKQSYRNRTKIFAANGPLALTIPVLKKSNDKTKIGDIAIKYDEDWQSQHWKSICSAYKSSPYFEYYQDDLEQFFSKKYATLFDLNKDILDYLLGELDMDIEYALTAEYQHQPAATLDLRGEIHPKKANPMQEKLKPYWQVFADVHGFQPDLSILDLLCNEGPNAENYLLQCLSSDKN